MIVKFGFLKIGSVPQDVMSFWILVNLRSDWLFRSNTWWSSTLYVGTRMWCVTFLFRYWCKVYFTNIDFFCSSKGCFGFGGMLALWCTWYIISSCLLMIWMQVIIESSDVLFGKIRLFWRLNSLSGELVMEPYLQHPRLHQHFFQVILLAKDVGMFQRISWYY